MGYGPPVQIPLSLGTPRDIKSPYNPGFPEMEELPFIRAAGLAALKQGAKLPAMPPTVQVPQVQDARAREAEIFAAEMGAVYGITRAQNKASKKRAKAKGRAAQRAAERR